MLISLNCFNSGILDQGWVPEGGRAREEARALCCACHSLVPTRLDLKAVTQTDLIHTKKCVTGKITAAKKTPALQGAGASVGPGKARFICVMPVMPEGVFAR